jgi:hypothetical protein
MARNVFIVVIDFIRKWIGKTLITEQEKDDEPEWASLDGPKKDVDRATLNRINVIEEYDGIIKEINAANLNELHSSALKYFKALRKHVLSISNAEWFIIRRKNQLKNPYVILERWSSIVKSLLDDSGNLRTDISSQEIVDVVTKMLDLNKWDKCGFDTFMGQDCKSYVELRRLAFQKNHRGVARRQKIYDKTEGRCAYCGVKLNTLEDMTIDHIIPISSDMLKKKGLRNNLPACLSCNHLKDDLTVKEFRMLIKKLRKASETRWHIHAMKFNVSESNRVSFFFEDFGVEI